MREEEKMESYKSTNSIKCMHKNFEWVEQWMTLWFSTALFPADDRYSRKRTDDSDAAKCLFNSASPACSSSPCRRQLQLPGMQGTTLGTRRWRKSSSTASLCDWGHAFPTCPYSNSALALGDVWFQPGMVQPAQPPRFAGLKLTFETEILKSVVNPRTSSPPPPPNSLKDTLKKNHNTTAEHPFEIGLFLFCLWICLITQN